MEDERYQDYYGVWHSEKPPYFTDLYGNHFRREKDAEDAKSYQIEEEEEEYERKVEDKAREHFTL